MKKKYGRGKYSNSEYIDDDEETINIKSTSTRKRRKKNFFFNTNKYIYIIPISIFIFLLLFFRIIYKLNYNSNNTDENNISNNTTNITFDTTEELNKSRIVTKDQAIDNAISYISNCASGKLVNNETLKIVDNPLISVVIPCYFCQKYIKGALRSIQNQNFYDVDIIIVNDDLDNNSINTLKELANEDPRIEIIYNNKRMGILYTRSIGVLHAKGEFVTTLDQDDFFSEEDVFDYLYKVAKGENIDILVFKILEGYDYANKARYKDNNNNKLPTNLTLSQPELSCHTIMKDDKTFQSQDIYIWGKLYRSLVYKSAINLLGKDRYSVFMEWEEDVIMSFLIVNVANSYKFIEKYGYFHLIHGGTPTSRVANTKKNYYRLIKVEIFFDFTKKECKMAPVKELIEMKNIFAKSLDDETKNYLERLIKKIFGLNYIENKYKEQIKNVYRDYFPNINNF